MVTRSRNPLVRILSWHPYSVVLLATVLSFLRTGYLPIDNNNVYHLPILMNSFALPQFASDPFIQSLQHFSSGFWIVFTGAGEIVNPKLFLAFWLAATHLSLLAAALHLARSFGFHERRVLNIYVLLLAMAACLQGTTVGGAGVMLNYFTHSELANAPLIFGFSYAVRGRYAQAAIATALTFFLNAFMAVWMILPLCFLAAYQLRAGAISWRALMVRGLLGSLIGGVLLVPPLLNVLSNHQILEAPVFSYRRFLRGFYPAHFFLDGNSWLEVVALAAAALSCFLAAAQLGRQANALRHLAGGASALLVIGAAAPLVTDSALVLNLHLIRSAVMIMMLSTFAVALLAAAWMAAPDRAVAFRGLTLAIALVAVWFSAAFACVLFAFYRAANRLGKDEDRQGKHTVAIVALCTIAAMTVIFLSYPTYLYQRKNLEVSHEWQALGSWADHQLPPDTKFLIWPKRLPEIAALGFEYTSRRQQIFATKFGAAVMWSPAYFDIWDGSRQLRRKSATSQDILAYASTHGAAYLGTDCDPVFGEIVHQEGDSCVYAVSNR